MALRHEKRLLQKSEINLGREGCSQAVNFPEVRNEIVALKKLEQEQKRSRHCASRRLEEGIKQIEAQRQENAKEQNTAIAKLEEEKKPIARAPQRSKSGSGHLRSRARRGRKRLQENDTADRDLLKQLSDLQTSTPPPADLDTQTATLGARRARLPEERAEMFASATRQRRRLPLGQGKTCRPPG